MFGYIYIDIRVYGYIGICMYGYIYMDIYVLCIDIYVYVCSYNGILSTFLLPFYCTMHLYRGSASAICHLYGVI